MIETPYTLSIARHMSTSATQKAPKMASSWDTTSPNPTNRWEWHPFNWHAPQGLGQTEDVSPADCQYRKGQSTLYITCVSQSQACSWWLLVAWLNLKSINQKTVNIKTESLGQATTHACMVTMEPVPSLLFALVTWWAAQPIKRQLLAVGMEQARSPWWYPRARREQRVKNEFPKLVKLQGILSLYLGEFESLKSKCVVNQGQHTLFM